MEATRENFDVSVSLHGGASIVQCKPEFSIDSKYVMCSSGHVIKVVSVRSGDCVHVLKGHTGTVTGLRLHPTNQYQLLSCGLDKTVIKWDYRDGVHVKTYNLNFPVCALFTAEASSQQNLFAVLKKSQAVHSLVTFRLSTQDEDVVCEEILPVSGRKFHTAVANTGDYTAHIDRHQLTVCRFGMNESKKTKIHTFKDPSLKARLSELTCVECHPTDRCVATGTKNGRIILWYNFFSGSKVVKNINHWHSLAVEHLSFTTEGSYLLSGGHECVLVKWQWNTQQKDFLPRLGSAVISISCSRDNTHYALCHMENGIQVVTSSLKIVQSFQGLSQAHIGHHRAWRMPAGLHIDPKTKAIVTNGRPGHLQFYDLHKDRQLCMLDVVGQNYVSPESLGKPFPVTNVMCVDFDGTGDWLGTVECWNNKVMAPEIRLKFWVYVPATKGYKLNTLVDLPHNKEVTVFKFQPRAAHSSRPMAVTASKDGYFKMWALVDDTDIYRTNQCWSCDSVGFYRERIPGPLDFSEDGTILAVAFSMTLTLWDPTTAAMQATFTIPHENESDVLRNVVFGRESCSHFLMVSSDRMLYVWNLLTCSVSWRTPVEQSLVVQAPLSEVFAVFSSGTLKVYTPDRSEPLYTHAKVASSTVKCGLFVPKRETGDLLESGPLSWQKGASLYFMDEHQELLTLKYAVDVEEKRQTVEISSQNIPQTPFSILFNEKRKQGYSGRDSSKDVKLSKRMQSDFLKEMLNTPAHVMPPTTALAMSFMSSLMIKSDNSPDTEEEDDSPQVRRVSESDADSSDSSMEVDDVDDGKDRPMDIGSSKTSAAQENTSISLVCTAEYDKLKPRTFKWL